MLPRQLPRLRQRPGFGCRLIGPMSLSDRTLLPPSIKSQKSLDAAVLTSWLMQVSAPNSPNLEYTEETWARDNRVNYDGVMWTAQAAGKIFKKQGKGNFIITASVSATLVNIPQTQVAYNASKAAALHLAKSLAVEWVDFARINYISPGFMITESKHIY
ncbi:hypothetical protein EIK77_005007 [Talaromyces pinophilus]|nr:hypothetical protein EIK77_005007 [Talaromyces pinophilus]